MTIQRFRLVAFSGLFLLIAASVAVTLWALRAQQDDAVVINLAGRQRMFIQQMALEALNIQVGVNPATRQTLHETADTFEQTLNALIAGGEAPYAEGTTVVLPPPPAHETEILAQLKIVRAIWDEMHSAIHTVLQNDPQSEAFAGAMATVQRLSPVLIAQMDKAVQLYEAEARRKVAFVRTIQLGFLATAAAMLIVAIFITERWLLAPIARLEAAARGIGEGDMATPVSVAGLGEIDRLAHSLDEMRRRLSASAETQAALLALSRRLLAAKDERAVAECAVEAAASALHTDFSALVLPDAKGRLIAQAVRGWPADFAGRFELAQGDASQTGYTVIHGHPVVVEDYSAEMAFTVPPVVFEYGIISGLSVPMFLEGRVVGAMLVHSRTRRRFGEDEIRLLSLIANQAAIALEKARLFEAERKQLEELAVLYALATVGVEATNVDTLIKRAIQIVGDTLHPDYFGIGLVDEAAGVLRIHRSTRTVKEETLTIPLGQGVAGRVVATGQPQRIPDASREPAYLSVNPGTCSELCVPLKVGQRVIGLINVESTRLEAFSEADERLMMTFAGQLATAIERMRLYTEIEQKASELGRLYVAAQDLAATLDPSVVLEQLARHLTQALDATSGYINAVDVEGDTITVLAEYWSEVVTPAERVSDLGRTYPLRDFPMTVRAITRGEVFACHADSSTLSSAERDELAEHGIRSELIVPIIARGQSIGAAQIWESRQPRDFTKAEKHLAQTLAQHGAGTIHNTRLFQVEQRGREVTAALLDITQVTGSSLELKQVLKHIAQRAAGVCQANRCTIFLLDEVGECLKPVMSQFADGHTDLEQWHILQATTADRVDAVPLFRDAIRERRPALLNDAGRTDRVPLKWTQPFGIQKMLAVPLLSRDQAIGLMALDHIEATDEFTPEQIDLALTIGGQVAASIENAQLYAQTRQRLTELRLLHQASQALNADLSLEIVLNAVADHLIAALDVQSCTISSWDSAHDEIVTLLDRDPEPTAQAAAGSRFRLPDHPHYYTLLLEGRSLAFRRDDPGLADTLGRWLDTYLWRSLLTVPLVNKGRVTGLIELGERRRERDFSADELRVAESLASQAAAAIENARLYAEAEARADELAMLARVGEALNRAQTADETLQLVLTEAVKLVNREAGSIIVVEPTSHTLRMAADIGLPPAEAQAFNARRLRADEGTFADSIGHGEMVEVSDTTTDPRVVRDYTDTFTRQLTNVPLKTGSGVIGAIALDGLPLNDRDRRLLRALADLAAVAIEKAELLEETRRRADQLRALHEASRALTSDLRLEVVLQTLTETARHLAGARYAALAVLDVEGTQSVAQFHTAGLSEAERQRIGAPPQGRGLLGAVLREGVPIRLADLTRDPRSAGFPPHHPPMKALMTAPIVARGKIIGSLYLTDKANDQAFTQEDEDLMMRLAADAAIAIENARLFGAVQQLATTDSLTGLHNRRRFFELAEHEFQRARRYGRSLSAIMLDIDRFKRVNDAYGHAVGDQVLQTLAARCRETLRDIDFMGRYGGEEFVVLLPENDVGGARSAAERLRQCVAESPIETYRGPVSVTISLGVAAMTEDCPDVAALLDRADAAMYAAKRAGRNRVC